MPDTRIDELKAFLLRPRVYYGALLLLAAGTAIHGMLLQRYVGGWNVDGRVYTRWNNFVIFRDSFHHLVEGRNLYARYPAEQFDLFKYSPTFATAMAPFALLPERLGLVLWNLLNAAVLILALKWLPELDDRTKGLMVWFVLPEFQGACRNTQANVLMAGLMILAYALCERRRWSLAALSVAISIYVKPFGMVAALLFLLYPQRRRLALLLAGWVLLLGAVPLLVVSPEQLFTQLGNWRRLLAEDFAISTGLSVDGWLQAWFGLVPPKRAILAVGTVGLLLPLVRVRAWSEPLYRRMLLASILIWVVIFNHKAESATFVIAMCGVALWYFGQKRSPLHRALAAATLLCTSIAYGDLVSSGFRREYVIPYVLKVVGVIFVWAVLVYEETTGHRAGAPAALPEAPRQAA